MRSRVSGLRGVSVAAVVALVVGAVVLSDGSRAEPEQGEPQAIDRAFCVNMSLGGQVTYPHDSNGDGVADICSLPYTRREAVARQAAADYLVAAHPQGWAEAMAAVCMFIAAVDFGDSPASLADDLCAQETIDPADAGDCYTGANEPGKPTGVNRYAIALLEAATNAGALDKYNHCKHLPVVS